MTTSSMPEDGAGGERPLPKRHRRAFVVVAIAFLGVAALLGGWLPRHFARERAARFAMAGQAPPRVNVVAAKAEGEGRELTLPGGLVANQRTLVYARATGYVKRWLVDIGDHVRAGQSLAELETPDLDQQVAQARAVLVQRQAAVHDAIAQQRLAHLSAERQSTLAAQKLVAQQDADNAVTQAKVSDGNVDSAKADVVAQRDAVRQLEDLKGFANVTAPFDGTVTKRLIEVGSLVSVGTGNTGQALFEVESTDPLRVFIRVPQTFALSVRVGESADVVVRQYPGRKFAGKVTRTASSLDPTSRTLETELVVPNGSGELLAGMYCEVTLAVQVRHRVVRVPASAIIFDASGVRVATVGKDDRVHLVTVQQGRTFGSDVELVEGLTGGERVLSAPPADVAEGMPVQPVGA